MKKKFHDLLHAYKVEAYRITHNHNSDAAPEPEVAEEIKRFTEDALNHEFHYHFHKEPSPERLETITMIKNFTVEALLPPVIEKVMQRTIVLERQHRALVKLVDGLLGALSEEIEKAGSQS